MVPHAVHTDTVQGSVIFESAIRCHAGAEERLIGNARNTQIVPYTVRVTCCSAHATTKDSTYRHYASLSKVGQAHCLLAAPCKVPRVQLDQVLASICTPGLLCATMVAEPDANGALYC